MDFSGSLNSPPASSGSSNSGSGKVTINSEQHHEL
jgi:hypothetical protein